MPALALIAAALAFLLIYSGLTGTSPKDEFLAAFGGKKPSGLGSETFSGTADLAVSTIEGAQMDATVSQWVKLSPHADRPGVHTRPEVLAFVARVAQIYGHPLTIGTGTNHNQFVKGRPGVQSDHWIGKAADVPMVGIALTRLGQCALIAAGMPASKARHQTGGIFNVGNYQIIFNTMAGGNHYTHCHMGVH